MNNASPHLDSILCYTSAPYSKHYYSSLHNIYRVFFNNADHIYSCHVVAT